MTTASKDQLQPIMDLPTGWDSHGGKPITEVARAKAEELLTLLDPSIPTPWIVPRSCGGLQLEWRAPSETMEVYIDPFGMLGWNYEAHSHVMTADSIAVLNGLLNCHQVGLESK